MAFVERHQQSSMLAPWIFPDTESILLLRQDTSFSACNDVEICALRTATMEHELVGGTWLSSHIMCKRVDGFLGAAYGEWEIEWFCYFPFNAITSQTF